MHRRHVVVRGTVQGVFFRASTQQEASRLALTGWVANRPDGSVEAEVEGDADAVEAFVHWAHGGPPRAVVTAVDVTELATRGGTGFDVR